MKKILVVDDDKTNLVLARSVLGERYRVIAVSSGEQALKYLENNVCDLILLDINMPEMDGYETMQRIRGSEALSEIPVIFLAAENNAETETRCLEMGATDFIEKPFVPAVMLSRIGRVFEFEDMRRQLAHRPETKINEAQDFESRSDQDAPDKLWNRSHYHFLDEQAKDEELQGRVLVDLKYLREIMSRADSGKGAYQLDLNNFHHVYNFIRRSVERSGQDVQTVLFTLQSEGEVSQDEIDEALETLERAIYFSLRRTDVSTRYSGRQVIVILMDANADNGDLVARRIVECFERTYKGSHISFTYDIAQIEGGNNVYKAAPESGYKKTILVVDDDKTNLIAAKSALGEIYKVIAVSAGQQALQYMEKNSCDLVLLDMNMPEMDGV